MKSKITFLVAFGVLCQGCSKEPDKSVTKSEGDPPETVAREAVFIDETAGGLGLARIELLGFARLNVDTKRVIQKAHLAAKRVAEAADGSRDPNERLKEKVFLGLLEVENEIPKSLKDKIIPYIRRNLVERRSAGPRSRPPFIPGEFAAVAQVALTRGVDLGVGDLPGVPLDATHLERLEALLAILRPIVFGGNEFAPPDGGTDAEPTIPGDPPAKEPPIYEDKVLEQMISGAGTKDVLYGGWRGQSTASPTDLEATVLVKDGRISGWAEKLGYRSTAHQSAFFAGGSPPIVDGDGVLLGALEHRHFVGERSVVMTNIQRAIFESMGETLVRTFSGDESLVSRRLACADDVFRPYQILSRTGFKPKGKNDEKFGGIGTLLAEVHYQLAVLDLAFDERLQKMGVLSPECAKAVYDGYVSAYVEQLVWTDSNRVEKEMVRKSRRVIFSRLHEHGAVNLVELEGHYYAKVVDHGKMKAAAKKLLDETARVRRAGDIRGATVLLAGRDAGIDENIKADAISRYEAAGMPKRFALLNPHIQAKLDLDGNIIDVTHEAAGTLKDYLRGEGGEFEGATK